MQHLVGNYRSLLTRLFSWCLFNISLRCKLITSYWRLGRMLLILTIKWILKYGNFLCHCTKIWKWYSLAQKIYLLLVFVGNRNLTCFVLAFESSGSMKSSLTLLVIQTLGVIKWLHHIYISHISTVLLCSFRLKLLGNSTKYAAKAIFHVILCLLCVCRWFFKLKKFLSQPLSSKHLQQTFTIDSYGVEQIRICSFYFWQ